MIRIYTVSDKRPDFIELQYNGFKRYLLDKDYELIICNNGSTPELRTHINEICDQLGLQSLYVEGNYENGAIATQVPLIYCLKNYVVKDNKSDITVLIDSDIFPFAPLSFELLLGSADMAGIYQQRDVNHKIIFKRNHFYIWNALMIFRNHAVNFTELDISLIQNVTDVGGKSYKYIKKFNPKITWLSHTADIEECEMEIFHSNIIEMYKPVFGMQVIEGALVHYYRGSNWDSNQEEHHKMKTDFLRLFLKLAENNYPLVEEKLNIHSDIVSHARKHYNGKRDNYKSQPSLKIQEYRFKWI